jgi:hypothetical protein
MGLLIERFWSKVDKNGANGCWNWTGRCDDYGRICLNGTQTVAHRVSYIIANGSIPDGLIVRHKCLKNRKCVNPEHLELGTHQDNSTDMVNDDTQAKGVENGRAKLTEEQVKEIRRHPIR